MLFDDVSRDYKGTRGYTEPIYVYFNRSARPSSQRIRNLLEEWFSNYPSDAQNEIVARFRSSNDIQHQSAFFEIYLHVLLSILGFQIEVHPEIPEQRTHPEFLVFKEERPFFYLEATLAAGPNEERAADKRINAVYTTIDKMESPNFFIGVEVHGSPITPPPGRKWRAFLENWLSKIDPDTIIEHYKFDGIKALPSITKNHDGWNVAFQAIPKSPEVRGKSGVRPIGMRSKGIQICTEDEWIKNAIKEKATRYGNLQLPFLIAINVLSIFSSRNNFVMDALFGKEGFTSSWLTTEGSQNERIRAPNGAFRGPQGPQNTRVSGVIICSNLSCGNINKTIPALWHNPWASLPLDQEFWILPQYILNPENNCMEFKVEEKAIDLFGLPTNWPIQEGENDFE